MINLNLNKKVNERLTKEEILKAKDNGFILIGKTGVGKTTLLNLLFKKNIGKIGDSSQTETKVSNYYYLKENINSEIFYFCIIDTPGLYDSDGLEDNNQIDEIKKLISQENIKIKGLFYLINFQEKRFDLSIQDTFIKYTFLFPIKDFWKRIILIFSHYYGDPEGETKEEMKENSSESFSKIFSKIMEKTKRVSEPIDFMKINKIYVNMNSKPKNVKQENNNELIRKEIVFHILKYKNLNPLFSKIKIFNFEKYKISPDDKDLYDCIFTEYLDFNGEIIHKNLKILKKYTNYTYKEEDQKIEMNIEECDIDKKGFIIKKCTKKQGLSGIFEEKIKPVFESNKGKIGSIISVISILGFLFSGNISFLNAVYSFSLTSGGLLIKYGYDEKENKKKEEIIEIIKNEKIDEELIQLKNFNK